MSGRFCCAAECRSDNDYFMPLPIDGSAEKQQPHKGVNGERDKQGWAEEEDVGCRFV
jgi:hypothetical protein